MIAFWIAAGVLSALAAALVLRGGASRHAGAEDPRLPVYRRHLREVDSLAERGLLTGDERGRARAEAARRLLAAADQTQPAWTDTGRAAGLVLAAVTPIAALAVYLAVGSAGYPDQPFAQRLAGWQAADLAALSGDELAAVVTAKLRTDPNNPEGLRLLAMIRARTGDPGAAARALRRAVALAPERIDLWQGLGEALVQESGGEVTAEARAVFDQVLKRDPRSVAARIYLAGAEVRSGDRIKGLAAWRALLAELPAGDPRHEPLAAAIAQAERPAAPAPVSGEAMAAIRGMVAGLAARLETRPDDPDGWVRLVRSYAVLGATAERDAALAKARTRYAANAAVLGELAAAAAAEPMR